MTRSPSPLSAGLRGAVASVTAALPLLLLAAGACSSKASSSPPLIAGSAVLPDAGYVVEAGCPLDPTGTPDALATPERPDASCAVLIESPPRIAASHVAVGSVLPCESNPPTSGAHYPVWANYGTHSQPVPRGYYLHDEEHGGVVLLYRCDAHDGCPSTVAALQKVADALPTDPACAGFGVRVRYVITEDDGLDAPIAAAAWGWSYKAACFDEPSLLKFAKDHYGQGREATCEQGGVMP